MYVRQCVPNWNSILHIHWYDQDVPRWNGGAFKDDMNHKRNIVGPQIRKGREQSRPPLTQQDLAARLEVRGVHIDRAGISKVETGYRVVTDIEHLAFADALGTTVQWLIASGEKER